MKRAKHRERRPRVAYVKQKLHFVFFRNGEGSSIQKRTMYPLPKAALKRKPKRGHTKGMHKNKELEKKKENGDGQVIAQEKTKQTEKVEKQTRRGLLAQNEKQSGRERISSTSICSEKSLTSKPQEVDKVQLVKRKKN